MVSILVERGDPKMRQTDKRKTLLRDAGISLLLLLLAIGVCTWLSQAHDDNNPFAVSIFILAVALTAFFTHGYVWGILQSAAGVVCVNWLFTRPFGLFTLSVSGYPLTFATMLVVSVIISTLTSQIKRQEQLRFEAEAETLRANLLRSVSHDIRTPLTSILGASSLILETPDMPAETQRDLVGEIHKDAQWLIRMTENLLSVTKCSGTGVALKTEAEVVEEIVSGAVVKFHRSHPQIPVEVRRPKEIVLARMDATLIEQVLVNLFENAAIHGETTTRIWVDIVPDGEWVHIRVADNGVGFQPSQLPRAFDGYVAHDRSVAMRRNMGIGLNVCRAIIRAHGGDITANNQKTGGAEITFWLPQEEDPHGE